MTNLYYAYKFNSSKLHEFKYHIQTNYEKAVMCNEIIAIGESQMIRSILDITNRSIDYQNVWNLKNKKDRIYKGTDTCNRQEIKKLEERIRKLTFVPEYITVKIESIGHYNKLISSGFSVNGVHYQRMSCSSSQARGSIVTFVDSRITGELQEILDNGRNKTVPIAESKFNAYFGLYTSATHVVSAPRVAVIPDYENQVTFKANFIKEMDHKIDDEVYFTDRTERLNRTDGMGLISPDFAKIWGNDLGLDYTPCQFCIRQSYLKGMVTTFDFVDFCHKKNNGDYKVKTIYKKPDGSHKVVDLRYVDVIISESQFKLWDHYISYEEYEKNCQQNNLLWGVTQFTPKYPKRKLNMNYQFIQSLNLTKEDIPKLADEFVTWIQKISYDDPMYSILFLLGENISHESISYFLESDRQSWIKALLYNPDLIQDAFIRKKIYEVVKTKIEKACLGKIFVDGNFQVLISDPYAFMQHVCELPITGLLSKGEFYSNYWNEMGVQKVDAMRSPLTYRSEHVVLDLADRVDMNYWFQYMPQGIVLNWFGHEVVNFAGADFDYDIIATTSNPTILNSVFKDEYPVVYDAPKPQKVIPSYEGLCNADRFAFGSIIGQITNKGSSAFALLSIFEKLHGVDSFQYQMTLSRLKQCCKAQSAQIDKTKIGKEVKGIPSTWTDKIYLFDKHGNRNYTYTKEEAELYNSMLLNRYPYFFKYLYPKQKRAMDDFWERCKQTQLNKGLNFDEIDYKNPWIQANIPLIYSDSAMNLLCRYIEDLRIKVKEKRNGTPDTIWEIYKNKDTNRASENSVIKLVEDFMKNYHTGMNSGYSGEYENLENTHFKIDLLRSKIAMVESNFFRVTNYLVDYFYSWKPQKNKTILWLLCGEYMVENIKKNSCIAVSKYNIDYLGQTYQISLERKSHVQIQRV